MIRKIMLMVTIAAVAGCSQEQPATYEVPKTAQPQAPVVDMGGTDAANQAIIEAHEAMKDHLPQTAFEAELPEGWTEKGASGMRLTSYAIDGTSIDFYLTALSMGDVPSNVNRWRGQVGLPAATPEEITAALETFDLDGRAVNYIEIYNEEDGKGIIAAILDLSPSYWYFTAKGTAEELKANAGDIRNFIKTITIK